MKPKNININTSSASFWQILVILLLFVGFLTLLILFLNPQSAQAEKLRTLRDSVQSEMTANYSIDIARGFVPQISLSLVREIISNRVAPEEVSSEFNIFMNSLGTLVPTVTPDPSMLLLKPVTPEPTRSLTRTTTLTISPTITLTTTETETATPTSTASSTPWIVTVTWTPWPTDAYVPASSTPRPFVQPTVTEVLPTDTPVTTTATAMPVPTFTTAEPATPVPTVPPVIPTLGRPSSPTPTIKPTLTKEPDPTKAPTQTNQPEPTKEPKPTKVPKDTKTPKEDTSEDSLKLVVPMLSTPVVIK
jgi:hypothetical protein